MRLLNRCRNMEESCAIAADWNISLLRWKCHVKRYLAKVLEESVLWQSLGHQNKTALAGYWRRMADRGYPMQPQLQYLT